FGQELRGSGRMAVFLWQVTGSSGGLHRKIVAREGLGARHPPAISGNIKPNESGPVSPIVATHFTGQRHLIA
ncbi:MAG: hypothetical protein ACKO85_16220, partial [Isosphaeraceae bacterium]